jgi:pyridoxamine 5'-phosphate oxidase
MKQPNSEPDFYNDLALSLDKAWSVIEPGISNRTSAAHTPVVATVNSSGIPQQRVMVLRAADRNNRRLRFHTDARAAKNRQCGQASVLMYDAQEKVQIRLEGLTLAQTVGDDVDSAWQNSTTFARRCYMAEVEPGSPVALPMSGLPEWIEGKQPVEEQLASYRANFALLWFDIQSIEWLYLANTGHRRAKWDWNDAISGWSGRWLVP